MSIRRFLTTGVLVILLLTSIVPSIGSSKDVKWRPVYSTDYSRKKNERICEDLLVYLNEGVPNSQRLPMIVKRDRRDDGRSLALPSCPSEFRPERIVLNHFAGPDPVDAPLEFWKRVGRVLLPETLLVYEFPSESNEDRKLLVGHGYRPTICDDYERKTGFRSKLSDSLKERLMQRCSWHDQSYARLFSPTACAAGGAIDIHWGTTSNSSHYLDPVIFEHGSRAYMLIVRKDHSYARIVKASEYGETSLSNVCSFKPEHPVDGLHTRPVD